jgi:hypothetical protein
MLDIIPTSPSLKSIFVFEICKIVIKVEEDRMAEILSKEWFVGLVRNFSGLSIDMEHGGNCCTTFDSMDKIDRSWTIITVVSDFNDAWTSWLVVSSHSIKQIMGNARKAYFQIFNRNSFGNFGKSVKHRSLSEAILQLLILLGVVADVVLLGSRFGSQ